MELKIDRVIETVLYVSDIERADAFYREVLKLPTMAANERFRAYNVGDRSVLLLFIEGDSLRGARTIRPGLFLRTMAWGRRISGWRWRKSNCRTGNGIWWPTAWRLRGGCAGNTAGRAFIFAIPTPICWNW